jgi:hypothetical protein
MYPMHVCAWGLLGVFGGDAEQVLPGVDGLAKGTQHGSKPVLLHNTAHQPS